MREGLRWARQHLYTLLILSPLVLGISYLTLSRLAEEAPAWQPSTALSLLLSCAFVLSLTGLSLTRATGEIFHLRRPESVLDSLPVSPHTQLDAALLKRFARTFVIGALALLVRALFAAESAFDAAIWLPLFLFILITALAQTLAALNWIHWGHTKSVGAGLGALLTVTLSAVVAGLLLHAIIRPRAMPAINLRWLVPCGLLWATALYLLARFLHERWRASDIEYAKRLEAGSRLRAFGARRLEKRFERAVAVQLERDLQLTLRAFSSAVYVSLFITLLFVAALITVLLTGLLPEAAGETGWFDATWLPAVMAAKVACVLMCTSLAVLVAVLVTYQLPHFWLERALGTTGRQMWETKLWYARIVSLPAPFLAWIVCFVAGGVPLFYALPLLAECLWLWWIVSTLAGGLAFEVPDRPELSIILMLSAACVFGLFVSVFWPAGFVLFALNVIRILTERGQARAGFLLVTEGD